MLAEICMGGKDGRWWNPRLLNELMANFAEIELSYSIKLLFNYMKNINTSYSFILHKTTFRLALGALVRE